MSSSSPHPNIQFAEATSSELDSSLSIVPSSLTKNIIVLIYENAGYFLTLLFFHQVLSRKFDSISDLGW